MTFDRMTMKNQIAIWKVEHTNLRRLLDVLDAEIRLFHEGARPDYDLMLDAVDYLIHYPDRFHHPKEDAAFERLLDAAPDSRALADAFKVEHRVIADSGALLVKQLQGVVGGILMPRAAVEGPAATYSTYYRQHMAHEEAEFCPRAERLLGAGDWAAVEKAVPVQRDPLFGDRPEERYAALYRHVVKGEKQARPPGGAMSGWIDVAPEPEFAPGTSRFVEVGGAPVAVFHVDDGYYAIEDVCTHDGGPLAGGDLEGDVVVCPRHGARFSMKTGEALTAPAYQDLPTFEVRVDHGVVQVRNA
jgi:nitrite reductase/ring-hydroxylating ferredoxin subunit/hemerythrin-like domain-containing protein